MTIDPIKVPDLFLQRTGVSMPSWLKRGYMPSAQRMRNYDFGNVNPNALMYDDYNTQKPHIEVGQAEQSYPVFNPEMPQLKSPARQPQASPRASNAMPNSYSIPRAPVNVSGIKAYVRQNMRRYGWDDSEWDALHKLIQNESGWNYKAANPTSSARGLGQTMMSVHFGGKGWKNNPDALEFLSNPNRQADWTMKYVHDRYNRPSSALNKWYQRQRQGHAWY